MRQRELMQHLAMRHTEGGPDAQFLLLAMTKRPAIERVCTDVAEQPMRCKIFDGARRSVPFQIGW